MQQHVDKLASLCYYHLRRLKKVCRILSPTIKSRLVSAFLMNRLDYWNTLLTGLPQTTIAQLQRVQNAAVCLVSNLRPRDKVSASLRELHWLPIQYHRLQAVCLMMHNAYVGPQPALRHRDANSDSAVPNRNRLRSSASTRYELPAFRLKIRQHAFSYFGPAFWNSLPSDITWIMDILTIRAHLKTHLLRLA